MPTPKTTAAIADALHSARFAPYRAYCAGNDREALKLYRWNLELSAAFHEVLSVTEVVLRNAIDKELRVWNLTTGSATGCTEHWAIGNLAAPLGSLIGEKRLKVARDQARSAQEKRDPDHPRYQAVIDHNDVLTQFTFGLWRDLLPNGRNRSRTKLWEEALIHAFPHAVDPDGSITYERVGRLHSLRNRVGHMEQLLESRPAKKHRDALLLIGSVCPDTMAWLSGVSRVPTIIKTCPVTLKG